MGYGLGTVLGAAAKSGRETYEMLAEEEARRQEMERRGQVLELQRQDNALQLQRFNAQLDQFEKSYSLDKERVGLAATTNKREQAKFDTEMRDRADKAAAYSDLGRGMPDPSYLGGPKEGTAPAPRRGAIPTPGAMAEAPTAPDPAAPAVRASPVAPAPALTVGKDGRVQGPEPADAPARPPVERGPAYYEAREEIEEKRSQRRERESQAKYRESLIKKEDFDLVSKQAGQRFTTFLPALKSITDPDDTPLDDRADTIMRGYADVYSQIPDGNYAEVKKNEDGSFTLQAISEKTDEVVEEMTFKTFGDVRRATLTLGQGLAPDNMAKMWTAELTAKIAESKGKQDQRVLQWGSAVMEALDDPTNPAKMEAAEQAANAMGAVDKDVWSKVEDENGKREFNRVLEGLKAARPQPYVDVVNPETGKLGRVDVDQFVARLQRKITSEMRPGEILAEAKEEAAILGFNEGQFKLHLAPKITKILGVSNSTGAAPAAAIQPLTRTQAARAEAERAEKRQRALEISQENMGQSIVRKAGETARDVGSAIGNFLPY